MRYTPFETMERLFEQMLRDLNDLTPGWDWTPAVDLTEHDAEFVLTLDLPGFEKDEIDLRVHEDVVTVRAVHEAEEGSNLPDRRFTEQVHLTRPIDEDAITASYRNGVLVVTLPFEEDAIEHGHQIDIA